MGHTKTIGRENSAARIEQLNEQRDRQALSEALDESPLNGRERALQLELLSAKRQLDIERARNSVLVMGGKGSAPIGDTHERLAAVEERVLATGDMNDAAKLKHLDELRADMAKHKATREAWLAEVEGETAKRVEASDQLKAQAGLIITP